MESNSLVSSSLSDERSKSISPIEERLISILKDGGPLTRDQLVKKMAIPRTTIYDGLKKLITRNEIKKFPFYQTDRSRGRPQILFSLLDDKK
jgi:predicted ArsR family transcriptional regulator